GECSHRGRCSYRGPPLVGAPVAGAIWGGAFGRAGHAVRTGGGPAIRRCSYRGGVAFWVCRSTRDGCDMGWRIWACWARRSHRGGPAIRRCSYGWASRFGFVGAPVAGAIWGGAFGCAGHAVRTGAVRRSGGAPTGGALVGAPAPGAKGPASLIIQAREFPRPPSLLHPTPLLLSSFLFSR